MDTLGTVIYHGTIRKLNRNRLKKNPSNSPLANNVGSLEDFRGISLAVERKPSEKNMRTSNWIMKPQGSGIKITKYLSCHHLVLWISELWSFAKVLVPLVPPSAGRFFTESLSHFDVKM